MSTFETLYAVNVNDHTEPKGKLTYLSWTWAWAEVKKKYPDAVYAVWKDENHIPYIHDPKTGYMVFTTVTIEGLTHEMWLPIMDSRNNAMTSPTMFDVNRAIMRCLTKNLAMFGLGLYVYAGEDLPDGEETQESIPKVKPEAPPVEKQTNETKVEKVHIATLKDAMKQKGVTDKTVLDTFKVKTFEDLTIAQFEVALKKLDKTKVQ